MRLTLKVKLAATFIVVVAMSAGSIFLAIQNLGSLDDSFNTVMNGNVKHVAQTSAITEQALTISRNEVNLIIAVSQADIDKYNASTDAATAQVTKELADLRASADEEGKRRIDAFSTAWGQYLAISAKVGQFAAVNSQIKARVLSQNEGESAFDAMLEPLATIKANIAANPVVGPNDVKVLAAIDALKDSLVALRATESNIMVSLDDPTVQAKYAADADVQLAKLPAIEDGVSHQISVADAGLFNVYKGGASKWLEIVKSYRQNALDNTNSKATDLASGDATKARNTAMTALNAVTQYENDQMTQASDSNGALYEQSRTILIGLLVGSALIAAIAAIWIVLSISRGIANALRLANSVAAGDLSATATASGNDEIKDLVDALNTMARKLREVVAEVTTAKRNVASGSQDLSATAEQLCQGATEQASSTEVASASMVEMAATINQ
ncbi:MAG: uncharacterized protein JWN11_2702, partial [Hyphomicrobiales bacterium]|nr:uncharacterized protein [Hyphomicrobiales bacterium]